MYCEKCGSDVHRDDAMNRRCNNCEHLVRQCICKPNGGGKEKVKVTIYPRRDTIAFDSLDEFFDWLYKTYRLTTANFFESWGFHANRDQSVMSFVNLGIYLIVEVKR